MDGIEEIRQELVKFNDDCRSRMGLGIELDVSKVLLDINKLIEQARREEREKKTLPYPRCNHPTYTVEWF